MHLFIATSKIFITVFHNSDDQGVKYENQSVWVDGEDVSAKVYGKCISAATDYKYLGVMFDSCANATTHIGRPARQPRLERGAP